MLVQWSANAVPLIVTIPNIATPTPATDFHIYDLHRISTT
jgi:hypothetical protein